MSEINLERRRILVKICQLYYEDGLNQQEIAKRLGISRPHVSRMLTAAKNEGIVRITIQNPFSGEQELEKRFAETFGIQDAIIIDASAGDPAKLRAQLGRTGAALLESVLMDGDIVGIMAGRTVASAAEELDYFAREELRFVPLIGGWGSEGGNWHANSNTMAFANRLKAKYWMMHAPATVASVETGRLLRQEPEIAKVLQLARQSRVAVISIGEVDDQATMVESGSMNPADVGDLEALGAAANLCASFIDAEGRELDFPERQRWIGLSASELRAIPTVIGMAGGERKVKAITAALRGKWIDILVTDAATARAVLAFHQGGGTN
ncbi:sugar-binding transcriptional regulator [Paenibacillus glycinis]|uniref:Helix-turn-helix domain-containing protein n=1 Tax=Paenibacillus glycinis TaxID=2697035 RepID=A0ABW9XID6_9BACL|nr:sugar-binding transcriptional regulator [Paenibacillus glycinis]NBD22367.1 helix-turn-helix domain-containing protein [Paenibacillus glycinis]